MKTEQKPQPLWKREPINKRPGRLVCICTAKGHITYMPEGYLKEGKRG